MTPEKSPKITIFRSKSLRLWELLSFFTGVFAPSELFFDSIVKYLEDNTKMESNIGLFAVQSLSRLNATVEKEVKRRLSPSTLEMESIKVRFS